MGATDTVVVNNLSLDNSAGFPESPYNASAANRSAAPPDGGAVERVVHGQFFDTYFSRPRFAVETTLAALAVLINVATLVTMRHARHHRSKAVYNTLFVNLAVANMLTCALSWLCNNVIFLFEDRLVAMVVATPNACRLYVYLTAAVFVTSASGVVSTLTMLGFTAVQYFAICRPLHHQSILRKRKVRVFVACSWLLSLAGGISPFVVLLLVADRRPCDRSLLAVILRVVIAGVDACVALVGVIFVVIVALCVRIFARIRRLGVRIAEHRHERSAMKGEKRAFVTIVILVVTLATLVIPYTVVYVVSLNSGHDMGIQSQAVIYYMNLLPYLKFLLDPLIYGLRMREFKEGCVAIGARFGLKQCACWKVTTSSFARGHYPSYSLHHVHSGHSSSSL